MLLQSGGYVKPFAVAREIIPTLNGENKLKLKCVLFTNAHTISDGNLNIKPLSFLTMEDDPSQCPTGVRDRVLQHAFNDSYDEVDPNLYGEETVEFDSNEHVPNNDINASPHRPSNPVALLPPIKSGPKEAIIEREHSYHKPVDDNRVSLEIQEEPENVDANLSSHKPTSPVAPLPRIKSEPRETIIEREQCEQSSYKTVDANEISLEVEDELENVLPLENCPPNPQRRKNRRLIPEVLLHTWKDLQKKRKEDLEKIKKMHNPIIKKPKNVEFSLDTLYDRFKEAKADPYEVTLDPDIRDQPVSRAFMSSVYGGGPQDTFPSIGQAKVAEHGMRNFMYVNAFLHTHAPQWPGNPGLFFDGDGWTGDDTVYQSFVRIDAAKWLYIGNYRLFTAKPVTKDEWNSLSSKARNAWVAYLMKKGWAEGLRARIVARREQGRQPTRAEWIRVLEEGRSNQVTPSEIHAALDSGNERLAIMVMKCVGYNADFQRQLVGRFSRWVPPAPRPKGQKRGRQGKNNLKLESDSESKSKVKQEQETKVELKPTPQKPRKRKRRAAPESDAELSVESEDSFVNNNDVPQDKHFKKKLRRQTVVKKQEDHELLELSDNGDDGDWRPEIETGNVGSPSESQASAKERVNGTQDDPIIL